MSGGRIRIGRLDLDRVSWAEALDRVEEMIFSRSGGYVLTPNVDHVVLAERDEDFRRIYREADLVLADGQPLIWAARLLGTPLPEKISGSDFIGRFAPRAVAREVRIFFLGGRPGAAPAAARLLEKRHPGLMVVGTACPPPGFESDKKRNEAVIAEINRARPDLVFVALGTPKQEKWIARHRAAYAPALSFPVGAGLDFISGQVRRAPAWMQASGLEWFWRLCREPGRMARRYLIRDARFFPILWRQLRER